MKFCLSHVDLFGMSLLDFNFLKKDLFGKRLCGKALPNVRAPKSCSRQRRLLQNRLAYYLLWLLMGFATTVQTQPAVPQQAADATIEVWNREIAVLRSPYDHYSPSDRAERATEQILAIPEDLAEYKVNSEDASVGNYKGAWITVNGLPVFGILREDANQQAGENFEQYTNRVVANLEQWLEVRRLHNNLPRLLRSIAFAVLASLAYALAGYLMLRSGRWILSTVLVEERIKPVKIGEFDLKPYMMLLGVGVVKIASWAFIFTLGYWWLAFVLAQFPYSAPWAMQLSSFFFNLFSEFGISILNAIPNLVTVALILLLARMVVRVLTAFFYSAEGGANSSSWLAPETARATRRIAVFFVWVFAVVIAYPYIPGSDTQAFKGVSVLIGLMVSLGSAALVAQVVGGLLVVYTRAFSTGDFIRVGEHEGTVKDIGMLSTRIVTGKKEEITIPNSVLVTATTINYSRHAKNEGSIISTSVTIGYDAPWRQVQQLLVQAALRTPAVHKVPAPLVMQCALADFYVEYTLWVTISHADQRYMVLSDLHANIQDIFNENSVQIMSPHFERQPAEAVLVPKEKWHLPLADTPQGFGDAAQ